MVDGPILHTGTCSFRNAKGNLPRLTGRFGALGRILCRVKGVQVWVRGEVPKTLGHRPGFCCGFMSVPMPFGNDVSVEVVAARNLHQGSRGAIGLGG